MRKILVILFLGIAQIVTAQVVQQQSPTRTWNYQGGISMDSFFRMPYRVPTKWKYNVDSTGTMGFDLSDKKLKMNNGSGIVTILTDADTALIKYFIEQNPKLTIVWDSVKNKPGIIDTIESKFEDYYTKSESDARYLNQEGETIIETHKIFRNQTSSILYLDYVPLSTCHLFFKLNNVDIPPEDMVIDWSNKRVTAAFPILVSDFIAIYYSYKQTTP